MDSHFNEQENLMYVKESIYGGFYSFYILQITSQTIYWIIFGVFMATVSNHIHVAREKEAILASESLKYEFTIIEQTIKNNHQNKKD